MRPFTLISVTSVLALSGCGPMTIDHSPTGDLFDAETSDLEDGIGHWDTWYSTAVSHQTGDAAVGQGSLAVQVTAPDGWGVGIDNYPGFPAAPGVYRAELYARGNGSEITLQLELHWADTKGNDLAAKPDLLDTGTLGTTWKHYQIESTAPAGTVYLNVALTGRTETSGLSLDVDEIRVYPKP